MPATPAAEGAPVDAEKTPAKPKPRILALDDEPSIRAFLRTALTRHGMDCQPFPDGAHALEGLREATFDVMLIDHRMPLMSGTEFYEAAVAFRPEMARRAIFMSGDTLNPDLRGFATQRGIRLLREAVRYFRGHRHSPRGARVQQERRRLRPAGMPAAVRESERRRSECLRLRAAPAPGWRFGRCRPGHDFEEPVRRRVGIQFVCGDRAEEGCGDRGRLDGAGPLMESV